MPRIDGIRYADYLEAVHPSGLVVAVFDYSGDGDYNYCVYGAPHNLSTVPFSGGNDAFRGPLVSAKRKATIALASLLSMIAGHLHRDRSWGKHLVLAAELETYASALWASVHARKMPLTWQRITEDRNRED